VIRYVASLRTRQRTHSVAGRRDAHLQVEDGDGRLDDSDDGVERMDTVLAILQPPDVSRNTWSREGVGVLHCSSGRPKRAGGVHRAVSVSATHVESGSTDSRGACSSGSKVRISESRQHNHGCRTHSLKNE
jgi:hypothetical protein